MNRCVCSTSEHTHTNTHTTTRSIKGKVRRPASSGRLVTRRRDSRVSRVHVPGSQIHGFTGSRSRFTSSRESSDQRSEGIAVTAGQEFVVVVLVEEEKSKIQGSRAEVLSASAQQLAARNLLMLRNSFRLLLS